MQPSRSHLLLYMSNVNLLLLFLGTAERFYDPLQILYVQSNVVRAQRTSDVASKSRVGGWFIVQYSTMEYVQVATYM